MGQSNRSNLVTDRGMRRRSGRRLTGRHWWWIGLLIGVPLALITFKQSSLPGSDALARNLSLEHLTRASQLRTEHLLFTPLGAMVVVFTRLTLGLRVLGPFRSVLLAIAFLVTGIPIGLSFFALVLAAVVVLRPAIKSMRLPYFGRSTVLLGCVAGIVIAAMLAGHALGLPEIERVAYFPIVVLTLAGEAFATAIRREGASSAIWRASATATAAVVITLLASIRSLEQALLRYPELVLVFVAGIIIISDVAALRLLQHLNPPPKRRKKSKSRSARRPAPAPASVIEPSINLPTEAAAASQA